MSGDLEVLSMHPESEPVQRIADALAARFGDPPELALVLGSGLGPVVDRIEPLGEAPSKELGLPGSSVVGHAGRVLTGTLGGAGVVVFSGRVHLYEGWSAHEAVRYVRAAHRWGVKRLLLTCSAGGIAAGLEPGQLVAICDHINLQRENPLMGPSFGETRFPDVSRAYDPHMRQVLRDAAKEVGVPVSEGVYAAMNGPAYETPAEIRMLRAVGADLVGMSTVPEILAAAQVGLQAAAIAVISNRAAGLTTEALTHEEVTLISGQAASGLASVLEVACARF